MHCPNLRTDCTHGNPIVGARAKRESQRLHLQRLRGVRASIDNKSPFMGNIERQQGRGPRKSYQQRSIEMLQAHENFKMLKAINATRNRPCQIPQEPLPAHSLNIAVRRNNLRRIRKENQVSSMPSYRASLYRCCNKSSRHLKRSVYKQSSSMPVSECFTSDNDFPDRLHCFCQEMLERLDNSKPMVATVSQHKKEFAEHKRRLDNCSYSSRRQKCHMVLGNSKVAARDQDENWGSSEGNAAIFRQQKHKVPHHVFY